MVHIRDYLWVPKMDRTRICRKLRTENDTHKITHKKGRERVGDTKGVCRGAKWVQLSVNIVTADQIWGHIDPLYTPVTWR
ncbi:hypothetical protein J6590_056753 [Homalodisca vitripennis]|nr:hypothetical protein J6590_056753 [Homalodisca vitripennis]